jgi:ABC-type multidrug transport system fused ATPase/permease subunit
LEFGFARLLELFKERFGQRVYTVLLILIATALVGVCLNVIWSYMVSPLIELYHNWNWPQMKAYLSDHLLPMLVSVGLLYFVSGFLFSVLDKIMFERRLRAAKKKLMKLVQQELDSRMNQTLQKSEELVDERFSKLSEKLMAIVAEESERYDNQIDTLTTLLRLIGNRLEEAEEALSDDVVDTQRAKWLIEQMRRAAKMVGQKAA